MKSVATWFFFGIAITIVGAQERSALQAPSIPTTFGTGIQKFKKIHDYTFGSAHGRSVTNLNKLAELFDPYGIAGLTTINKEWERYQPFNDRNFVFQETSLNLTATIAPNGGLFPGGIDSGQLCTKQTFKPGVSGHKSYAFEIRMHIPSGAGMWPAAWFYSKQPGQNDGSEIDNPEFFTMTSQNEFDWTGFLHGPGRGAEIYSLRNPKGIWHPGFSFAADYHNFQTLWSSDAVFKYVDGKLISAERFSWTSPGAAQLIVSFAVGSDEENLPGLKPVSISQFPCALKIDHITIWGR